jgi:hypothetical protein
MFECPAIRKWTCGHPTYSTGDITNRGYLHATIPCGTKIFSLVLLRICTDTTDVWCFTGVHLHFSLRLFGSIHGALEKSADEELERRDWRKSSNWEFLLFLLFCRARWLMPPGCTSASAAYCTYPDLDVPTFTASRLSRPHPASDPGSQSRNYAVEKWPINFAETPTSTKRLGIFYMP